MNLTRKQTATYNAALCMILDHGHDLGAVTREVDARVRNGTPPRQAYERALNNFVDRTPSMLAPLQQVTKLIEASSIGTVAQYNVALSRYIETGDDSSLRALAPMIAQDMTDLAARNGEAAPEFSEEMDGLIANAPQPSAPASAHPATFRFVSPGQPAPATDSDGIE